MWESQGHYPPNRIRVMSDDGQSAECADCEPWSSDDERRGLTLSRHRSPLLRTRPLTDGAQNNNTWGETPNISQMWLDLFAIKQSLMLAPDLVMAVSRMFRTHHRVVILPLPTRTRPDSVKTSWATQLLPGNQRAQQRKIFISRSTFISFIFARWARCQDV